MNLHVVRFDRDGGLVHTQRLTVVVEAQPGPREDPLVRRAEHNRGARGGSSASWSRSQGSETSWTHLPTAR